MVEKECKELYLNFLQKRGAIWTRKCPEKRQLVSILWMEIKKDTCTTSDSKKSDKPETSTGSFVGFLNLQPVVSSQCPVSIFMLHVLFL